MKKYTKTELFSTLKPYFIIVSSVLLIMLIFFNIVLNSFRNEINTNFSNSSAFFSKSIDEKLHITEDYADTLIFSNSVSSINKYSSEDYSNLTALKQAYDIVYNIRRFITSNALIDDIYIYYPDSDFIIGKEGFYNSRTYYALTFRNKLSFLADNNYSFWMNSVFFTDQQRFFTANTDRDNNPEAFFKEKTADYNQAKRIIVVKLDNEYIEEMMSDLFLSTNYRFVGLVDENNTIYASAGDKQVFLDYPESNNRHKYIRSISESEIWGMKFVAFQEYDSAYNTLNIATIITTIGFILSILVSAVLSFGFSSRHIKTINKISGRLSDNKLPAESGSLSYIEKRIEEILNEKDTAIGESNRQQITIEKMLFRELLLADESSRKDMEQQITRYGMRFNHPVFSLIIVPTNNKPGQYFEDVINKYSGDAFSVVLTDNLEGKDVFLCNYANSGKKTFTSLVQKIKRNYNDSGQCRILRGGTSLANVLSMWNEYSEHKHSPNIEKQLPEENGAPSESAVDAAQSIIENEFTNPQLGLGIIAERLNVSQPYLSKQFKHRYGIGINNYINQLRIDTAKQYLLTEDSTVSEIAVRVGYANDVNFIRVFKKYENTTPGNFRLSGRQEK